MVTIARDTKGIDQIISRIYIPVSVNKKSSSMSEKRKEARKEEEDLDDDMS